LPVLNTWRSWAAQRKRPSVPLRLYRWPSPR